MDAISKRKGRKERKRERKLAPTNVFMKRWVKNFGECEQHEVLAGVIVFVWSQYDGGNIEQRTIGYGCCQNQEAK